MESYDNNITKPLKAKKLSISILVISLPLLYVSLLHLPPSSLFKDTTFWFLISNSIIIIVAADSGIFASSSSTSQTANIDIYDEYIKHSKARSLCLVSAMPSPTLIKETEQPQDNANEIDNKHDSQTIEKESSKELRPDIEMSSKQAKCERSSSEWSEKKVEAKNLVPRSKSMMEKRSCGMEESEYWKMSDEELNKRVEEFIRRFNREIRLQEKMCTVF